MKTKKLSRQTRRWKLFFRITMVSLVAASAITLGKKIWITSHDHFYTILTPTSFSLKCTQFYSPSLKQKISHAITTALNTSKEFSPKNICCDLKETFPIINDISWNMIASKNLIINITGVKPAYIVNTTSIVGKNGKIFDLQTFEDFDTSSLRHIAINKNLCTKKLADHVFYFIKNIPASRWQEYDISYESPSHIVLMGKQQIPCKWSIITDGKNLIGGEKIKNLALIQDDMQQTRWKQLRRGRKRYHVVYDVRFENRVIVKMIRKKRNRRGR